jgi:hypothetical protein
MFPTARREAIVQFFPLISDPENIKAVLLLQALDSDYDRNTVLTDIATAHPTLKHKMNL